MSEHVRRGAAREPDRAASDTSTAAGTPDGAASLFISDLHLAPDRPSTLGLFLSFLEGRASRAGRLYVLGDLFDTWIGDDDDSPLADAVRKGLTALTGGGTACFIARGNRDFLIGRRFCRETGCQLIPDPAMARIGGEPTLLMHGDLLCTDDVAYQRFRRRIRNPLVIRLFLWKSLAARRAIAEGYRLKSGAANAVKSAEIMDVSPSTVIGQLQRHRATRLIHGHTHRPADHDIPLKGGRARRMVLAEWHTDRGEVLVHDDAGWRREPVT